MVDSQGWNICISDIFNSVTIPCIQLEWSRPFYGAELSTQQIMDLITFLQQSLQGRDDVDRKKESNLE